MEPGETSPLEDGRSLLQSPCVCVWFFCVLRWAGGTLSTGLAVSLLFIFSCPTWRHRSSPVSLLSSAPFTVWSHCCPPPSRNAAATAGQERPFQPMIKMCDLEKCVLRLPDCGERNGSLDKRRRVKCTAGKHQQPKATMKKRMNERILCSIIPISKIIATNSH